MRQIELTEDEWKYHIYMMNCVIEYYDAMSMSIWGDKFKSEIFNSVMEKINNAKEV